MKKPHYLVTTLLTSASLFALTACEEPKVDASIFESIEQCMGDPLLTEAQCRSSFKEAQNQHAAVAPKYATAEDCQADFGAEKCEPAPYKTTSGGSVFMPMMAGYMMGSMLGGRGTMMSQPLYRSSQGARGFRPLKTEVLAQPPGERK